MIEPPPGVPPGTVTTGVSRLDQLLHGGLPAGSAALLYGPAFLGKELLAQRAVAANLAAGRPAILILTHQTCLDARGSLRAFDPNYSAYEERGLVHFVDTYSHSIGAQDGFRLATYLDGALDLNALSVAINQIQRGIVSEHDHHVIVLDSLSTLVAQNSAQTAFRFMQTFIGRTRLVGATHIMLMDHGMHSDAELQMFKHLASGMISVRDNQGKPQILVQGLGTASGQSWIEYRFSDTAFDITGSFAAGRIR